MMDLVIKPGNFFLTMVILHTKLTTMNRLLPGVSMRERNTRLISASAASRLLRVNSDELEALAAQGKIQKHKISESLVQYDFHEIAELRRTHPELKIAIPEPVSNTSAKQDEKKDLYENRVTPIPPQFNSSLEYYQTIAQSVLLRNKIEIELHKAEYTPIDVSLVWFFIETPLFIQAKDNTFILFKQSGTQLTNSSQGESALPNLFIRWQDKTTAMKEVMSGLNSQLRLYAESKKVRDIKSTLINLLDVTLADTSAGYLNGLEETVEILVMSLSKNQSAILDFLHLLEGSPQVVLHSARVMAYVMRFCLKNNYSVNDTKILSLCALLHDIGKPLLPEEILEKPIKELTQNEIAIYESHTEVGHRLLKECGVTHKWILSACLEHHERLDGSGFPNGSKKMSLLGQLLGIIDTYDLIKNPNKNEISPKTPFDILKEMKADCDKGKYNRDLFESFAYSLL